MDGPSVKKSSLEKLIIQSITNLIDLKEKLREIIATGKNYQYDVSSCIKTLLGYNDQVIVLLSIQAVSELAKCEIKREAYAQNDIIVPILSILSKEMTLDKLELIKHCCRALGNLCCDCDTSRNIILQNNGVNILGNVLKRCMENSTSMPLGEIKIFVSKALLNYAIGGQEYTKSLVKFGIIENAKQILTAESLEQIMDDDLVTTFLTLLTVINDNDPELRFHPDVNKAVLNVLRETTNIDVSELALENLHTQAEHDSVKTLIAKLGGMELVCERLEILIKNDSNLAEENDVEAVMKQACDLIVIVLTGDDAMILLYDEGRGEVYTTMVRWLDSPDKQLMVTAVLAMGNFARRDSFCERMVDNHIFDKLLAIFERNFKEGSSVSPQFVAPACVRAQHASLSAIRNLCVPFRTKCEAAAGPAPDVLLRALPQVVHPHVAYKLLAALRLLLDGHERVAREVLCRREFLQAVCRWAESGQGSASAEAGRLLARAAQLSPLDLLPRLLRADCAAPIVDMLLTCHGLMQNEALVALARLGARCRTDPDLTRQLVKAEVGKHLLVLIDTNLSKMPVEVAENLIMFLQVMSDDEKFVLDCREAKVDDALKKFCAFRTDLGDLMNRFKKIVGIISGCRIE